MVEGKLRQSFDEQRSQLGMENADESVYRQQLVIGMFLSVFIGCRMLVKYEHWKP